MINQLTNVGRAIVPVRDKVTPVTAADKVNLAVDAPRINIYNQPERRSQTRKKQNNYHFASSPQFAIHVLIEAGKADNNRAVCANIAYNQKPKATNNILAII